MISRLQVQNYRVLRDIDCSLERFTCIVGPNGCGKSTILEVLEAALLSQDGGSSSPEPFRVNLCFPYRSGEALIWKRIVFNSREAPVTWSIEPSDPASDLVEQFKDIPPAVWRLRAGAPAVCVQPRFSLDTLKAASPVALSLDSLPVDGMGLAGLLADWKLEDDPRFLRVQQQLEKVVPQVCGLSPKKEGNSFKLSFLVGPEKKKIPAHEMSTGTLYTLALLVLLESLEQ